MKGIAILFTVVFGLFFLSSSRVVTAEERMLSVDLDRVTLQQGLERVAQAYGVAISVTGQEPQNVFSVKIQNLSLQQALQEVMKQASVMNSAIRYNRERNTVSVWLLSSAGSVAGGQDLNGSSAPGGDRSPLTEEQLALLRAKSTLALAELEEGSQPLTQEQIDKLRERSAAIEAEMEEGSQPLTQEQIDKLRERSTAAEAEMEEGSQPLTQEQIDKLRERSTDLDAEMEESERPLAPEQMEILRERSAVIEAMM